MRDGESAGEWTDHHAGDDVADDERLAEAMRQESAGECGNQHEREVGDEFHWLGAAYLRFAMA